MKGFHFIIIVMITQIAFTSCVSYNQLVSFPEIAIDTSSVKYITPPSLRLQSNDVLSIEVFGPDPETAAPFNRTASAGFFNFESMRLAGYLIDAEGAIDFPVIGRIKLRGLSMMEANEKMKEVLSPYLKDPSINMRLLNFKVTVSGEVPSPGSFSILDERITLPDALALAGGLTGYANRRNILVVREENTIMTMNRVDMQSPGFFESDYYYLKQNDLIYVEPLKSKAGSLSDQTNKVVPIISAIGTLFAIVIALLK